MNENASFALRYHVDVVAERGELCHRAARTFLVGIATAVVAQGDYIIPPGRSASVEAERYVCQYVERHAPHYEDDDFSMRMIFDYQSDRDWADAYLVVEDKKYVQTSIFGINIKATASAKSFDNMCGNDALSMTFFGDTTKKRGVSPEERFVATSSQHQYRLKQRYTAYFIMSLPKKRSVDSDDVHVANLFECATEDLRINRVQTFPHIQASITHEPVYGLSGFDQSQRLVEMLKSSFLATELPKMQSLVQLYHID